MRVAYSAAEKAEAVALARIVGAQEAANRLGMEVRAVRNWSKAAGVTPDVDPDMLADAHGLALAKVTAEIASGKLTGTRLATVMGILADKVRLAARDKPPPDPERTPVELYVDAIEEGFPVLRPDLVARWDGDAIGAFREAAAAFTHSEGLELEAFLRTFDPDAFALEQERADAEHRAKVAELIRASWLRHNGTDPGGRTVPAPSPDLDVAALLAEAEAYLKENRR